MTTEEKGPQERAQRAAATRRRRTRERVLAVARQVFDERGITATRVEDIARAAGMSAPTIYDNFGTKEGLARATYFPLLEPLICLAEAQPSGPMTTPTPVFAFVDKLSQLLHEHQALAPLLLADVLTTTGTQDELPGLAQVAVALSRLVEKHYFRPSGPATPTTTDACTYHLYGLLHWVIAHPDEPWQESARLTMSQMAPALLFKPL